MTFALDKLSRTITLGDRVTKSGGDYTYEGEVVAIFPKRGGSIRIVVEDDRGLLFIMAGKQVERKK